MTSIRGSLGVVDSGTGGDSTADVDESLSTIFEVEGMYVGGSTKRGAEGDGGTDSEGDAAAAAAASLTGQFLFERACPI